MKKNNLKKFKVKPKKIEQICNICFKEFNELSSITIRTYNVSHCYKGSNRPFIMNYKIRCCPKCFTKLMDQINGIIK